MNTVEIRDIVKTFGATKAVNGVTFDVEKGEIFGLLGPNGAGKTTIIRVILDIYRPDSGKVSVLGGAMSQDKKNRIGYLPEERGLYQDLKLEACLNYLARLKGMPAQDAKEKIRAYLERFDLSDYRESKVKELSKGMQQKAQLISTLVHDPELVIIDEPFTALDPVNTQMVKGILDEQRRKGVSIVMSTHQMHQVEELCDRLTLINRGEVVLYGTLNEIRRRFAGEELLVQTTVSLPADLAGVQEIENQNGVMRLILEKGQNPQTVLQDLVKRDVPIEKFEIAVPTLDRIFIDVVQGQGTGSVK